MFPCSCVRFLSDFRTCSCLASVWFYLLLSFLVLVLEQYYGYLVALSIKMWICFHCFYKSLITCPITFWPPLFPDFYRIKWRFEKWMKKSDVIREEENGWYICNWLIIVHKWDINLVENYLPEGQNVRGILFWKKWSCLKGSVKVLSPEEALWASGESTSFISVWDTNDIIQCQRRMAWYYGVH